MHQSTVKLLLYKVTFYFLWSGFGPVGFFDVIFFFFTPLLGCSSSGSLMSIGISSLSPGVTEAGLSGSACFSFLCFSYFCFSTLGVWSFSFNFFISSSFIFFSFFLPLSTFCLIISSAHDGGEKLFSFYHKHICHITL